MASVSATQENKGLEKCHLKIRMFTYLQDATTKGEKPPTKQSVATAGKKEDPKVEKKKSKNVPASIMCVLA